MSYQFVLVAAYRLDEMPQGPNHSGHPDVIVTDMPGGTVIGQDAEGDWFLYVGPDQESSRLPGGFSKNPDGSIRLFRDYWRYICHDRDEAPYYAAILNAKRTQL